MTRDADEKNDKTQTQAAPEKPTEEGATDGNAPEDAKRFVKRLQALHHMQVEQSLVRAHELETRAKEIRKSLETSKKRGRRISRMGDAAAASATRRRDLGALPRSRYGDRLSPYRRYRYVH